MALPSGTLANVETIATGRKIRILHWYEAHGIGRKDMKVKRLLD